MTLPQPKLMRRLDARWIALAIVFLLLDAVLIGIFKPGSDWAPLWTAGRLAWDSPTQLYDFDLVARLQGAVVDTVDFHPFVYPPSALLLVALMTRLPCRVGWAPAQSGTVSRCVANARRGPARVPGR